MPQRARTPTASAIQPRGSRRPRRRPVSSLPGSWPTSPSSPSSLPGAGTRTPESRSCCTATTPEGHLLVMRGTLVNIHVAVPQITLRPRRLARGSPEELARHLRADERDRDDREEVFEPRLYDTEELDVHHARGAHREDQARHRRADPRREDRRRPHPGDPHPDHPRDTGREAPPHAAPDEADSLAGRGARRVFQQVRLRRARALPVGQAGRQRGGSLLPLRGRFPSAQAMRSRAW